jgi:hypothetical protein
MSVGGNTVRTSSSSIVRPALQVRSWKEKETMLERKRKREGERGDTSGLKPGNSAINNGLAVNCACDKPAAFQLHLMVRETQVHAPKMGYFTGRALRKSLRYYRRDLREARS